MESNGNGNGNGNGKTVEVDMGFMGYQKPMLVKNMTPRLREFIEHIRANGSANSWSEVAELKIKEEEFVGPCCMPGLMIDNGGVVSVMALMKLVTYDGDFNWGHRPRLIAAYADMAGAPEWLLELYRKHWDTWKQEMAGDCNAVDNASQSSKCGPYCD